MSFLNTTVCSDPCGDLASRQAIASKSGKIYTLCLLMGVIEYVRAYRPVGLSPVGLGPVGHFRWSWGGSSPETCCPAVSIARYPEIGRSPRASYYYDDYYYYYYYYYKYNFQFLYGTKRKMGP